MIAALVSVGTIALIGLALLRGKAIEANRVLRTLPNTAVGVLHIDLEALGSSSEATRLLSTLAPERELSEIETLCELDPLTDLSEVTIWVRGKERTLQSFGVMLTGRTVDATRLAECHRALVKARGSNVIRVQGPAGPLIASEDETSALAMVGQSTVVTGSLETVVEAIATKQTRHPALETRPVSASLWQELDDGGAVRAVFEAPHSWKDALRNAVGDGESPALEGVDALGLSITASRGMPAELLVVTSSAERATQIGEELEGWKEAPPPTISEPWKTVLRSANIRWEGNRLHVGTDLASLSNDP